jgi:hypothetical protein
MSAENVKVLTRPLSLEEIKRQIAATGRVKGDVAFDFNQVMWGDGEACLDRASEALTGSPFALCDMTITPVSIGADGEVIARIDGMIDEESDLDALEHYRANTGCVERQAELTS